MDKNDLEKVLINKNDLDKRISELAEELSKDYEGKKPLFIGILKGAAFFTTDLVRKVSIDCEIDFMDISSYEGDKSTGKVKILKNSKIPLKGRNVIIVEDIVDTGHTMNALRKFFDDSDVASHKLVSLLNKPERREVPTEIEYLGFDIPDEFVVGYGFDYNEHFRNLPEVHVLKQSVYS